MKRCLTLFALFALLCGKSHADAPLKRDTLHWHLPHYHHSTPASAIRCGDWKLIEFWKDGALELYDLRADPSETTNLAA